MTQRINDKDALDRVFVPGDIVSDLLSLRAAVRRVLEAEDAWRAADNHYWKTLTGHAQCREATERLQEARSALRAEMAGIDKDGGA